MSYINENIEILISLAMSGDLERFNDLQRALHRTYPHLTVRWLNAELFWFDVSSVYPPTQRGTSRVLKVCRMLNGLVVDELSSSYPVDFAY